MPVIKSQYHHRSGHLWLPFAAERYPVTCTGIAAQSYERLSFGAGDAVIGVNPVTDDVENPDPRARHRLRRYR